MRGSCLCGGIAFEIDGPLSPLSHCHCSICRKTHGTAFASFAAAPASAFRWLRGAETIRRFETSPGAFRGFCPRCGSVAPSASDGGSVYIPLGLIDGDPGLGPLSDIFVGSKATWHRLAGSAERFEAFPPGFGDGVPSARVTEPKPGEVRGACVCGAVRYEIDAPIGGEIVRCHCTRCRKARAAAHACNLFVSLASFRWLAGEERVDSYKLPEALRFTQCFCRECGSPVPKVDPQRGIAVVPAGSLEDDPGIPEGRHIFVASKAPWFEIADAAPQYSEYPPA